MRLWKSSQDINRHNTEIKVGGTDVHMVLVSSRCSVVHRALMALSHQRLDPAVTLNVIAMVVT